MRTTTLAAMLLCQALFAQGITVSKDSILVYNNYVSSFADEVVLVNQSSFSIHLDSAFVAIEGIDTAGFGSKSLQLSWRGGYSFYQDDRFIWLMDSAGAGVYRLSKQWFSPSAAVPLSFAGKGDSCRIFYLEIGECVQMTCNSGPRYPRYVSGVLTLYFSNGQATAIRLRSSDLRVAVRAPLRRACALVTRRSQVQFQANGRRVDLIRKEGVRGDAKALVGTRPR